MNGKTQQKKNHLLDRQFFEQRWPNPRLLKWFITFAFDWQIFDRYARWKMMTQTIHKAQQRNAICFPRCNYIHDWITFDYIENYNQISARLLNLPHVQNCNEPDSSDADIYFRFFHCCRWMLKSTTLVDVIAALTQVEITSRWNSNRSKRHAIEMETCLHFGYELLIIIHRVCREMRKTTDCTHTD